jgi:hypothetical protein
MPPRRSARVAAVAERQSSALAPLPYALVLYIFSLLPVDQRLRCAEVSRGWRAVLSDASLWLRLDLSAASGVARATEALLCAATKRAAGGLQALDLTDCRSISLDALLAVAVENTAALVELRIAALDDTTHWWALESAEIEQLLQAAPQLRVLEADVRCEAVGQARRLLRNEAPFGPLRVRNLRVYRLRDADAVRSFTEDAAAHAWLTGVQLFRARLNLPAALDAVVDVALQLQLTYLDFFECGLTPASVPALVRLLDGSTLRTLAVEGEPAPLLDGPAALLLGNALCANTTLTSATFKFIGLFYDVGTAAALLGALTGHPRLRTLNVSYNAYGLAAPVVATAGAALAALVAANAPALQELHMRSSRLGDAGLASLVDALPHNTHLRRLDCRLNQFSEAFKRDRLLPAVRANPWLQALVEDGEDW